MDSFINSIISNREKVIFIYVILISLSRGVLIPDFRYSLYSIILIQFLFPIILFIPSLFRFLIPSMISYYLLCVFGIAIACLTGLLFYYLNSTTDIFNDQLTVTLSIFSPIMQFTFLSVLFGVSYLIDKLRDI